jgi:predicted amidohydrolase YtcJ
MVVDGAEVVWIGSDIGGDVHRDTVDTVVELDGALVTPAFVDSHIHMTSTGLALQTADLSQATSREHLLQLLTEAAGLVDGVVLAHGWDDTSWRDQSLPSLAEIDAAVGGRPAYITRTDVHSALVSTSLLALCPEVRNLDGFDDADGVMVLRRDAHHLARGVAQSSITDSQREVLQRTALAAAASLGVAAVHEMSGPDISSLDDLAALLALASTGATPQVVGYWGAFQGAGLTDSHRVAGAAGDFFVDGSIGSHTALLRETYADLESQGTCYLNASQIRDHIVWCTQHALQAGFHVIGDGAMDLVVAGLREAAAIVGADALRAARHRLEHAEMLDDAHLQVLLEYGVCVSVQPAFDERWGGPDGMYAQRLGVPRALTLNPFAKASKLGVALAFGSDSPVTPIGPWAGVRAAAFMHEPTHSLSARAAFAAHTRGGWRSVGEDSAGVLAPGYASHYAIWRADELVIQVADDRLSAWSTDPRSGTPGLPDLSPDRPLPKCLRTVVAGRTIYDNGVLEEVAP